MNEARISYLWQMAHLKFHFGQSLAMQAMHGMASPEMKSLIIGSAKNLTSGDDHRESFGIAPGASLGYEAKSAETRAAGEDSQVQSRKEPTDPQTPNLSNRIA
jgi:hypothetical protein